MKMQRLQLATIIATTALLLLPAAACTAQDAQPAAAQTAPAQAPAQPSQPTPNSNTVTAAPPQLGPDGKPLLGPDGKPLPPTFTIRRNVSLVVLDAVVVDANGNAITDLKREDFHISEDGAPQELRNFNRPGQFTPPADATIDSTADLDRVAPRAPVNIVLLDEFNTLYEDMAFARYSLKKFLDKQPDKLDTPTMLVAVSLQKFTVLRDYTQNKQEILDALDHHFAAYPWQAKQYGWVAERYAAAFLALRQVAEATTGHPGHKNMIWLGRGFPTARLANFSADGQERVNSAIQQTIDELRQARVTLYTIDPAGVQTDPGRYGMDAQLFAPFGGDPDFQHLAKLTGGRNLYGRNDVDAEIGKSIRDGSSLYTLTYYPTNQDRDVHAFRKISVTVDRPGLTVVTRPGYYLSRRPAHIGPDGDMNRKLATELIGAEENNLVYDGVRFTVTPVADAPLKYSVHVEPSYVPWSSNTTPRTAKFELLVTSFDKKGHEVARSLRVLTMGAPASAPPTGPLHFPVTLAAEVPPDPRGKAQITRARIVVRAEANGRMGTADVTLGDRSVVQSNTAPASTAQPPAAGTPTAAVTPQP